jgi:hypothetical protein
LCPDAGWAKVYLVEQERQFDRESSNVTCKTGKAHQATLGPSLHHHLGRLTPTALASDRQRC